MATPPDGSGGPGRPSKVARLIDQLDLTRIGDELEAAWTAEGDDRRSLRELADYFNRQVLDSALEDAGIQTLANEPADLYRLLTAEDVSSADRTRARRRLEREGIDVDALLDQFVSYQSVRSYLRSHRDVEYSRDEADRQGDIASDIQRLRGRTVAVTEDKLTQLVRRDELDVGSFRTIVDVTVVCEDCSSQFEAVELVERGGCDCGGYSEQ